MLQGDQRYCKFNECREFDETSNITDSSETQDFCYWCTDSSYFYYAHEKVSISMIEKIFFIRKTEKYIIVDGEDAFSSRILVILDSKLAQVRKRIFIKSKFFYFAVSQSDEIICFQYQNEDRKDFTILKLDLNLNEHLVSLCLSIIFLILVFASIG